MDDTDKQILILKTRAKTCFKGPSSRDRQDIKAIAKVKSKSNNKPAVKHSFAGNQFIHSEVLDRKCFVCPNGSQANFITESATSTASA